MKACHGGKPAKEESARKISSAGMTMQLVSMEGALMEYCKKEEDDLVTVPDQVHTLISEFC
eukprot:14781631-Ditylum_brightwellii.AAC.1